MLIPDNGITELQRQRYHAPIPNRLKTNNFKRLKLITLHQWLPNCDLKKFRKFAKIYV